MPHFYALAWIYRADYARGGFRMLTTHRRDGATDGSADRGFGAALLVVSVLPTLLGFRAGLPGFGIVLGAAFLGLGIAMALRRDDRRAMRLFLGSCRLPAAALITMVIDRLIA
jgi:heme o synthase